MELVKIIFEFFSKLLWPVTVMTIVLLFRKQLGHLIHNLKTIKAGGMEFNMTEKRVEEIAKAAAEETSEGLLKTAIPEGNQKMIFQDDESAAVKSPQESNDEGLSTMLAFAAGTSFRENLKYNIYYDPADRNHNLPFEYIGLYKDGEIRLVGKDPKIVYCNYDDSSGELVATNGDSLNRLTRDEYSRIKSIVEETDYYNLKEGCKFFLVDRFYETHLVPDSVIRGKQYFWLDEFEGFKPGMSAQELAKLLSERSSD
jgi:hypothetical protein